MYIGIERTPTTATTIFLGLAECRVAGGAGYNALVAATAAGCNAELHTCDRRALPVYEKLRSPCPIAPMTWLLKPGTSSERVQTSAQFPIPDLSHDNQVLLTMPRQSDPVVGILVACLAWGRPQQSHFKAAHSMLALCHGTFRCPNIVIATVGNMLM